MARITVGELRERLDDWGDSVQVCVVVYGQTDFEKVLFDIEVDDYNFDMEPCVTLSVDLRE
jgi:hypothetical protein